MIWVLDTLAEEPPRNPSKLPIQTANLRDAKRLPAACQALALAKTSAYRRRLVRGHHREPLIVVVDTRQLTVIKPGPELWEGVSTRNLSW